MRLTVMPFVLLLCLQVQAQNCPKYDRAMATGNRFLHQTKPANYDSALLYFQVAQIAARECGRVIDSPALQLKKVFAGLKAQRDNAIKAKNEAEQSKRVAMLSQTETKRALENLKKEKLRTESALAQANKLVDAFYFYDDKLALAFKNNRYGFINKAGDAVIPYKYEKAEQFDVTGLAKVSKSSGGELAHYLIDTTGKEYKVAYKVADLKTDITALDLSDQELTVFPEEIIQHRQLEILILQVNSLKVLPPEIKELRALRILNLYGNLLVSLPAEIGQLKSLHFLDLSQNKLEALPPEIGQLKALRTLNLSYDSIKVLPVEIGQLDSLQRLDLLFNPLEVLPVQVGHLKALKTLVLAYTKLKAVPAEIFGLKNLQTLSVHGPLKVLPTQIGELKFLKVLDLDGAGLKEIPPDIGKLKNLKMLSLMANQLVYLPDQIGQLTTLQTLNLGFNQLTSLPADIKKLAALQTLILYGNPISKAEVERVRLLLPKCKIEAEN